MLYVFDIEIFQNFFSVIFSEVNSEFDDNIFILFKDKDDREKLKRFVDRNITLIGFNNVNFDNVLLNGACEGMGCKELFDLAQDIIEGDHINDSIKRLRWKKVLYQSIDLMKIYAFDNLGVNLKRVGISLRWPTIQELPFPIDKMIRQEDVSVLLKYQENDVGITKKLYLHTLSEIEARQELGRLYDLNLINASDSRICNVVLEKLYETKTGQSKSYFKELRTKRSALDIKDCIVENIKFESSALMEFHKKIKTISLYRDDDKRKWYQSDSKKKFSQAVRFAGNVFDMGLGGLHSRDLPGVFVENKDLMIIDADVTSFYPMVIIRNRIKPEHLDWVFLDIYTGLINERIDAKAKGNKTKADGLKITINSTFGKFGFDYSWLYDSLAEYSVTISGQLYLLMLIESFHLAGIKVLSANTDGIVCLVNDEGAYYKAADKWMDKTGFDLEFSYYQSYIRKDVNNYIAKKRSGGVKRKGVFEYNPGLTKSHKPLVIPKALKNYFIDTIPVDETINNSDIYDFLMSQRADKKFSICCRSNGNTENIQKTSRYYVSTNGTEIFKRDETGKEISLCFNGRILNSICDVSDIDYDYYRQETMKIINSIRPETYNLSLF